MSAHALPCECRNHPLLTSAVRLVIVYRTCICGMEGGTLEAPVAAALWAHHVVAHPVLADPKATIRTTADPIVAIVGKGRGDEGFRQRVSLGIVSSPLSVCLAGDPGVL